MLDVGHIDEIKKLEIEVIEDETFRSIGVIFFEKLYCYQMR